LASSFSKLGVGFISIRPSLTVDRDTLGIGDPSRHLGVLRGSAAYSVYICGCIFLFLA